MQQSAQALVNRAPSTPRLWFSLPVAPIMPEMPTVGIPNFSSFGNIWGPGKEKDGELQSTSELSECCPHKLGMDGLYL